MITSMLLPLLAMLFPLGAAFAPAQYHSVGGVIQRRIPSRRIPERTTTSQISMAAPDLDVVALVAGQENYGLAIVAVGEGIWSYAQAPTSISHAARVLLPVCLAAAVLTLGSGPMITNADPAAVATGLSIATATSVALGVSYGLRLAAPFSPAPKEVAAVGLLIATAGFFSFAQNLLVNGFVTLPSLPSVTLPDFGGLLG